MQKADLEPRGDLAPAQVAPDDTALAVDGEEPCLVGAVEPSANRILHAGLYTNRNMATIEISHDELERKHDLQHAVFSCRGPLWLHAAAHRPEIVPRDETFGGNPIERVFRELIGRTRLIFNTPESRVLKPSERDPPHGQKII